MRVCVFVDGSNFYNACKRNLTRTDINLSAFGNFLVTPQRQLVRTYYYTCRLPPDSDPAAVRSQQRFLTALDRLPYFEVRYGKLVKRDHECPNCSNVYEKLQEKGVDMRIGVDMLALASRDMYDVAVLVTGDGDLREAVQAVKDLGKHVEVATFRVGRSDELVQVADVVTELTVADMATLYIRT